MIIIIIIIINIQSDEKQGPTTQITLPSKAIIQNQRTDKEIPRQEKAKTVYHLQTSITYIKVSSLRQRKKVKNMNNNMAINTYPSMI